MLSLSLVTLGLTTISAYAKPTVRAAASLEVSLSTPADKVVSVSELRIVSTVKNVGDEDLKVIKLGTVLDNEHYTRSFIVTKDEKQVPFTGVEVPVSTDDLSEKDLVVIPAGQNVTSEHDVSVLYDFSAAGPGTFTFHPVSSFQVIGLEDTNEATSDPVTINVGNTHPVSITVTEGVSKRELDIKKRWIADCPPGDRRLALLASSLDSKSLAIAAVRLLERNRTEHPDYGRYFGSNSIDQVYANFATIVNKVLDLPLRCAGDKNDCGSRGPVYASDDSLVYCENFFPPPDSATQTPYEGTPSLCEGSSPSIDHNRGALAFREFTHLLFRTSTYKRGCEESAGLSNDRKIQNADSYVCYAAEAYRTFRCGSGEST